MTFLEGLLHMATWPIGWHLHTDLQQCKMFPNLKADQQPTAMAKESPTMSPLWPSKAQTPMKRVSIIYYLL